MSGLTLQAPLFLLLLIPLAILAVVAARRLAASSRRRATGLVLRWASLVLLAVALTQPTWSATGATRPILFVVDTSASTAGARAAEAAWLRSALSTLPSGAVRGVVTFAGSAHLALWPARPTSLSLATAPDAGLTDIEGGLRLALGAAAPNTRLLLLSDGLQTTGDALAAAATAWRQHVPIDVVNVAAGNIADAAITRLQVPAAVHQGASFPLLLTVRSTVVRSATLLLTQDGQPVGQERVRLQRGDNPFFLLTLQAPSPGWHVYRATVTMDGDMVAENNALDATMHVVGPPRVLVVAAGDPAEGSFVALLREMGLLVQTATPRALPGASPRGASSRAAGAGEGILAGYDGLVLDDIPASALNARQVAALDRAVRVDGLGLLVLGGPHSLTLGHYSQTPLERMLPVLSVTPGSLQKGDVALQLVLDRSGSMNDLAGDDPKIVMAQAAANIAVDFTLQHTDDLGIVDFDITPHILVPLQNVASKSIAQRIHRVVNALTADGGTDIYAALRLGLSQVLQSAAPYKHIILMTDGVSEPANYDALVALMGRRQVTLSTVGLGSDADVNLLRYLARGGKGRFYYTSNAANLPHIFAEEARLSGGLTLVVGTIPVVVAASSPVVRSIDAALAPPVHRYVATVLKPDAVADLVAHVRGRGPDPLLSQWQYGLGRVLVWTPGVRTDWAGAWIAAANSMWKDAMQWVLRGVPSSTLQPELLATSVPPRVEIDTLRNSGAFINLAQLSGVVHMPAGGASRPLVFTQVGPGQYQAVLPDGGPGVYRLTVRQDNTPAAAVDAALALPYPQEYLLRSPDVALLSEVAAATGGRMLDNPRQLSPGPAPAAAQELWWPLAAVALLLFLADVTLLLIGGPAPSPRRVVAGGRT